MGIKRGKGLVGVVGGRRRRATRSWPEVDMVGLSLGKGSDCAKSIKLS